MKISEVGLQMQKKQEELAAQYKYRSLPPILSMIARSEYQENLPGQWKAYSGQDVYSLDGILLCHGLTDRVYVCGDYGIFLEAEDNQMAKENLIVKPGQEYRVSNEGYYNHIKYQWFIPKMGYETKLYFQKNTVEYADYIPGKWYFSPYEVCLGF